jgi:hypothetical protein
MSDVYTHHHHQGLPEKKQINIYNQQDRLSGVGHLIFLFFFRVEFQNLYVAIVYARSFWAWAASMESKAPE